MSRAADVFISYKAEDRRRIEPLVQALQADGYSVWWDQHIGTGDEWRETIERQLDSAKCVIVAWSKHSVGPEGRFVRDEASRAQRRRIYVPVLIDSVEPPLGFGESQATPLRGWRGNRSDKRYQTILRAVQRIVGEDGARIPTEPRPGVDRRALLAGGVAATATVIGIGAWVLLKPEPGTSDTIAVLPFANLSGDPAQAYFGDGIAGEIRNTLTRIPGLRVAGSTSSEAVRNEDAQTAAKKLGVINILTGNVRQGPTTIRINAELIDGRTGLAKWSQNYDRAAGDVIRIQTDIAERVVRALAVALGANAREALAAETSSVAAQTLAFQARDLSWQLTVPALQRCLQLLDQALTLDPNYARAYALKSFVMNNLADRVAVTPAELARARLQALQYAKIAVAKAPDLPIARSGLGWAYALTLQMRESLREHEVAISLPGGEPDVLRNYGYAISSSGKPDEALRYVDEALALDPLNAGSHQAHVSVLLKARRYEEVVRYTLKLKQESPELFKFPNLLGHALLMLGRTKEAALAFREAQSLTGEALLAVKTGNRDLALAKLAELRQRDGDFSNFQYGLIYAQLGEKERAFAALDRAWDIRDSGLLDVKVNAYLDPLRSDPRYKALVEKVGFPA
ncbi:MAG TPA: TIR domain-containing protein [Sphingomicrobium sp.]|nr:TIR domain-containing protein [Sphingomicrobium sp.]